MTNETATISQFEMLKQLENARPKKRLLPFGIFSNPNGHTHGHTATFLRNFQQQSSSSSSREQQSSSRLP